LRARWIPLALVAVSLACGFAGQRQFVFFHSSKIAPGAALYAIAIVAFVLAVRGTDPPLSIAHLVALQRSAVEWRSWLRLLPGLSIAVGCTAWALVLLLRRDRPHYWPSIGLWVAATASYLFTVTKGWPRREATTRQAQVVEDSTASRLARWAFPLALTLVALALRLYRLEDIQPTLAGDEANQALDAVYVLDGRIRNPFGLGWSSVPTMAGYLFSVGVAMLGNTMAGIRVMAALAGAAVVAATYLLVLRLHGRAMAWLTAALLATWSFHVHFSRLGATLVFDTLFMTVALWLMVRGIQEGRRLDWALAGVVIGLAQYAYAGARLTPIVVVACSVALLGLEGWAAVRRHWASVLVMIGAALVVAAPMLQVAWRFPRDYNARVNIVGIFQSGWIDLEVDFRHASKAEILADQVVRSVLGWNAYVDRTGWYGLPKTMLDFVPGVFFLLGLWYSTLRPLDQRRAPMLIWWWVGTVLGSMLTIGPPQSQRMLTLAVPVCYFIALAMERTVAVIGSAAGWLRRMAAPVLVASVALIGAFSLKYYFVDYTRSLIFGGINSRVATRVSKYARRELGPDWTVVFLAAPRIYSGFSTLKYLAPGVESTDVIDPLTVPPPANAFPADRNLCFVLLPERRGELELVRATFPGGVVFEEPPVLPNEAPIFTAYSVRRAPTTAGP
jgi:4-amino-4-deoxy-L-arabinose transferase-like glycosyltransferase